MTLQGHHKIWIVSIAAPTLQSWPHAIRFTPVWTLKASLLVHHYADDTALQNAVPVAVEEGEQLLLGGNTCSCSKVEEGF